MSEPFGKVVKVLNPHSVVFNKGSEDGVRGDDFFMVYSLGEVINDPDTGESLGQLEIVKGRGRLVHVQPHLTTIETYETDESTVRRTRGMLPFDQTTEVLEKKRPFRGVEIGDFVRRLD